jgi:hypothetical protein
MLKEAIAALAKEYQARGAAVVAISSNSTQTHPQDGPDKMAQEAQQYAYSFPYLFDESQEVGSRARWRCPLAACAGCGQRVAWSCTRRGRAAQRPPARSPAPGAPPGARLPGGQGLQGRLHARVLRF